MKQSQNPLQQNSVRKSLLAAVHIAAQELHIEDDDRRDIMLRMFGVESSKGLSDGDLRRLLDYFASKGWKRQRSEVRGRRSENNNQVEALRHRAGELIAKGEADGRITSARGLVKKICGVDNLEWSRDAVRLKRLLAVLESICHKTQRSEVRDQKSET